MSRMAFGRNQSAPMARSTRCLGSSICTSVLSSIPRAACLSISASCSRFISSGRGSLIQSALSRSTAMMSSCLVTAQNGR
ncbi:Uncharacterised protein [Mycobacteroides abscessus subsp. abscessus]|nr:Uncharacterised protein [Mycobacteroides abscessus subsp. abscessus]